MDVVCADLVFVTVLPLRTFVDVIRGSLYGAFIVRHIYNWNHWTFANCEYQKYNTTQKTIALKQKQTQTIAVSVKKYKWYDHAHSVIDFFVLSRW